jgi:hypothetical protein
MAIRIVHTATSIYGYFNGNTRPYLQVTRTSSNTYSFNFPDDAVYSATAVNGSFIDLGSGKTMNEISNPTCTDVFFRHPLAPIASGTSTVTGLDCANGNYEVLTSSSAAGAAFDYQNATFWSTGTSYAYYGNASTYTGATTTTTTNGTTLKGDYLQIKYPYRIFPQFQTIQSAISMGIRQPYSFYIAGSNNGRDFTLLHSYVHMTANVTLEYPTTTYNLSIATSSISYAYFRLIIDSGRILMTTGQWTCIFSSLTSQFTAVRVNTLGDIECISTDSVNCLWTATTTTCGNSVSSTAPSSIRPVICISSNYNTANHWCNVGRSTIDPPKIFLSEWSIGGTLGTLLYLCLK